MNQNVVVSFLARNAGFMRGAREVTGQLNVIDQAQQRIAKGMIAFGAATFAAYGAASKGAAEFEAEMRNVNSIVKESEYGFARMSNNILDLATKIPKSAQDLAGGAYAIASAGFTGAAEVEAVLEQAGKAASAGLTSTNTAATALVTTLQAYGLGAGNAANVSDILFQTVETGQISFEQLSLQLSDFIGMSRAAGSSLEETMSVFAALTIRTGNAARAGTGMAGILRSMIKPSEGLAEALDELYGMTGEQAVRTHGLTKVLNDLEAQTNGSGTALGQMFLDGEALNGVLAFMAQSTEQTTENLEAFKNASEGVGATQEALNEQSKSFKVQLDQMKASLGAAAIIFGQTLLPVLKGGVNVITFLARTFMDLPGPIKRFISVIGLVTGGLAALGGAYVLISAKLALFRMAWGLLSKAMANTAIANATTQVVGYTRATGAATTASAIAAQRVNTLKTGFTRLGGAVGIAAVAIPALVEAFNWLEQQANPQSLTDMEQSVLDFSRNGAVGGEAAKQFGKDLQDFAKSAELAALSGNELYVYSDNNPWRMWKAKEARSDIDALDKSLANLYATNPDEAIAAFEYFKQSMDKSGISASEQDRIFNDYNETVSRSALETEKGATATDQYATALAQAEAAAAGAGGEISALDRLTRGMTEAQRAFAATLATGYSGVGGALRKAIEAQNKLRKGDKKEKKAAAKDDPVREALDLRQATLGVESANRALANAEEELRQARAADPTRDRLEAEREFEAALDNSERAVMAVRAAEKNLEDLRKRSFAREITDLEQDLAASYDNTRRAEMALEDAHRSLEQLRSPITARSVEEAEHAVTRAIMAEAEAVVELTHAQLQLAEAQDHGTPEELAESERRLTEAQMRQKEALWATEDAQADLNKVRGGSNRAREIEEAELAIRDAERALVESQEEAVRIQEDLTAARTTDQTVAIREAELALRDAVRGVAEADQAAAQAEADLKEARSRNTAGEVRDAELALREAILSVDEAHHRLAETQRGKVGEATDEVVDDLGEVEVGLDDLGTHLRTNIEEHKQWLTDIQTIAQKFGPAVAAIMAEMGEEGRTATRELAAGTKEDGAQMARDLEANAVLGSEAFNTAIVKGLSTGKENAKNITQETVAAIAAELGIGKLEAERILDELGVSYSSFVKSSMERTSGGTFREYVPGKGFTGPAFMADGTEDHRAQIARGGAWRVWAEPETGGEAYIPLSPRKRRRSEGILEKVADKFGYRLERYASGGFAVPTAEEFYRRGVPPVEALPGGNIAEQAVAAWFARDLRGVGRGIPSAAGGIVSVGRAIQAMGFRVSEHPEFGGVDPVHTDGSYHYRGRAIDVNYYPREDEPRKLDELAAYLRANVAPIQELLWRVKGHYGHLHLAMANGGLLPGLRQATYDNGGLLQPGYTLAYNGTGQPERVYTANQGGGAVTFAPVITVQVRAEAGVDTGRLATLIDEKVNNSMRESQRQMYQELRKRG